MNLKRLLLLISGAFLISCKAEPEEKPETPVAKKISVDLVSQFSGKNALTHIAALEEFGPRPPESAGYEKSLQYLEAELKKLGWVTTRQSFRARTPVGMVNVSVPYLIGSHLDTKRYSNITFMGSNDSGSSTGVLVELARVFSTEPAAAKQVELVFFDGEEAMLKNIDPRRDGLYGSKYYAATVTSRKNRPTTGFVLDLVGDINVPLHVGKDSPAPLKKVAGKAVIQLGLEDAVKSAKHPCLDDHLPLIHRAQIPTLHLIGDFASMKYWHTKDDTMANLSPEALANSGKLTLKVIELLSAE